MSEYDQVLHEDETTVRICIFINVTSFVAWQFLSDDYLQKIQMNSNTKNSNSNKKIALLILLFLH